MDMQVRFSGFYFFLNFSNGSQRVKKTLGEDQEYENSYTTQVYLQDGI